MRISVIGCGYLGAVHAVSMAKLGHHVVGIDVDEAKIAALAAGTAPFFEPEFEDILQEALSDGRITFSTDFRAAEGCTVHFIAVGTPQGANGAADLRYVDAALGSLIPHLKAGNLVVGKSTVPVGTAARLAQRVAEEAVSGAALAWNPEFLREGFAVQDTITPDRIVYGLPIADDSDLIVETLDEVYRSALEAQTPRLLMDYATAELVKVSANAFLATKISFINAMSEIAEAAGADVTALADAIGMDARIGRRFLNAGVGFGGGCLPKDIRAFRARSIELGLPDTLNFLAEIDQINLRRRARVVELVTQSLGGDVAGRRVAVLGLAFKPESDDVRDSPALDVASRLAALGADVHAYDPEATETARRLHPDLNYESSWEQATQDAEITLVLTEWREFRELDPKLVAERVAVTSIVDGRNCLNVQRWQEAGFTYSGMGRGDIDAPSAIDAALV